MSVYYEDEHVTLYHGNGLELLSDMEVVADLILTDPPYGETSHEWDIWPEGWPSVAAAHSKSMWCFGSMRMFLEKRDEFHEWKLSQDVIWQKNRGSGFATDRFSRVHEHALHWYRDNWAGVHHDTPRVPRTGPEKQVTRRTSSPHTGKIGSDVPYVDDGFRLQQSVIYAPNMQGKNPINPTQKPVPVLEPLVSYGCPPGGLVLDLFAGSGATLVAARNLGRKSIGFELRESQCEKTAKRLAQGVLDIFGDAA